MPHTEPNSTILGRVSRGETVRRIRTDGDWVQVLSSKIGEYSIEKSRRPVPIPRLAAPPSSAPGLSGEDLQRLRSLGLKIGSRPAMILLPVEHLEGYQATIDSVDAGSRFGSSYSVVYKKGGSTVRVQLATDGIGDPWLQKPSEITKLKSADFGEISVAKLASTSYRPEPVWCTSWINLPGRLLADGTYLARGNYLLQFSTDFDPLQDATDLRGTTRLHHNALTNRRFRRSLIAQLQLPRWADPCALRTRRKQAMGSPQSSSSHHRR